MPTLHDDLGRRLAFERPPDRIVSLVPSITEAVAVTVPERLVGATEYCTHTGDADPIRVRGTKNPDHEAIRRLTPDLVVANREENRRVDVERLEASGIPVWVTEIDTVAGAFGSLRRLFGEVLGVGMPSWLVDAEVEWSRPPLAAGPHPGADLAGSLDGGGSVDLRRGRAASARTVQRARRCARSGIRSGRSTAWWRSTRTWSCFPTSPTPSVPATVPRRSRGCQRPGVRTGPHLVRTVPGDGPTATSTNASVPPSARWPVDRVERVMSATR